MSTVEVWGRLPDMSTIICPFINSSAYAAYLPTISMSREI